MTNDPWPIHNVFHHAFFFFFFFLVTILTQAFSPMDHKIFFFHNSFREVHDHRGVDKKQKDGEILRQRNLLGWKRIYMFPKPLSLLSKKQMSQYEWKPCRMGQTLSGSSISISCYYCLPFQTPLQPSLSQCTLCRSPTLTLCAHTALTPPSPHNLLANASVRFQVSSKMVLLQGKLLSP